MNSVQKTGLFIVIFGILIVAGLATAVIENQITLGDITQGNGKVNLAQVITISADLDKNETPIGIFAVQIMQFKENTFSAKVLDPSGIEIISEKIIEDTLEQEFKVSDSGKYELIIQSSDDEESYVKIITKWIPPKKPEIKKMSQNLFVNNNHDRIKQFLKQTISL